MSSNAGANARRPLEPSTYLTRDRAAQALTESGIPTSLQTLNYLAGRGGGPPFVIVNGRAIYKRADLEAWVQGQTSPAATVPGAA